MNLPFWFLSLEEKHGQCRLDTSLTLTGLDDEHLPRVLVHEGQGDLSVCQLQVGGRVCCAHEDAIDDLALLADVLLFDTRFVVGDLELLDGRLY